MRRIHLLIFVAVMALAQAASAQRGGGDFRRQVEALRKNVYARVLILSDEEAQKFWPVFQSMQGELEAVQQEMKKKRRQAADNYAALSDAELDQIIQQMMGLEQKLLDIRKKYYPEFKKALPIKKVALLRKAEREFKRELLKKYRQERGGPAPGDMGDEMDE